MPIPSLALIYHNQWTSAWTCVAIEGIVCWWVGPWMRLPKSEILEVNANIKSEILEVFAEINFGKSN